LHATRPVEQKICLCISAGEPTAKVKTAKDDHIADSLTARLKPIQALQ